MTDMKDLPLFQRSRWTTPLCLVLLSALIGSVFAYTVVVRRPWFGQPIAHDYTEAWTSPSATIFAYNWHRDGGLATGFAMYQQPDSVELSTAERDLYTSYPPTAFIPIYLISKLSGQPPTLATVMEFSLTLHLIVCVLIVLIVFVFLRQIGVSSINATLLAIVPIPVVLLMPGPMYHYQNHYWTDHAVLPLVLLFILLEIIREHASSRQQNHRIISAIQIIVVIVGTLTDWMFPLVALVVYVKRALSGQLGFTLRAFITRSIVFWMPIVLALTMFAYHLHAFGRLGYLLEIARYRIGGKSSSTLSASAFHHQFWMTHVVNSYGRPAALLLWISLAVFLASAAWLIVRRLRGRLPDDRMLLATGLIGMLLVPCFLQVYVLRQHSFEHDFSSLKFMLPLATVPFVLLPLLLSAWLGHGVIDTPRATMRIGGAIRLPVLAIVLLGLTTWLTLREHHRFALMFPERQPIAAEVGQFLAAHCDYDDVVFSSSLEIPKFPPIWLAQSRKRVHPAMTVIDIDRKLREVHGPCDVVLFTWDYEPRLPVAAGSLLDIAYEKHQMGSFALHKIRREDFTDHYPQMKAAIRDQLVETMRQESDVFRLHDLKRLTEQVDPSLLPQLQERFHAACLAMPAGQVLDENTSLLGFRIDRSEPSQWRVKLLFRTGEPFARPWQIFLHGYVAAEHVATLPGHRRATGYYNWTFGPVPATTGWPRNSFIIIEREIIASPIPYEIKLGFWRSDAGQHGQTINLGWIDLSQR